jgi:hypothetical protein
MQQSRFSKASIHKEGKFKKLPVFCEPKVLLSYFLNATTFPYQESREPSPHPGHVSQTSIFTPKRSTPRYCKLSLKFSVSDKMCVGNFHFYSACCVLYLYNFP